MRKVLAQAAKDFVDEISHPCWTSIQKAPIRIGVAKIFLKAAEGFVGAGGAAKVKTGHFSLEILSAKERFDKRVKLGLAKFDGKEEYVRQVLETPKNIRNGSAADSMATLVYQLCRGQAYSVNLTHEQARGAVAIFAKNVANLEMVLPKIPREPSGKAMNASPFSKRIPR